VRVGLRLPVVQSRGRLLNGDDVFVWISKRKNLVGWTYSYNPSCILLRRFKSLIAGTGRPCTNVRIATNTHIKCYIDRDSMLVGSFNLTEPTIQDLCVEIKDQSLIAHMRIQFRKHWNILK